MAEDYDPIRERFIHEVGEFAGGLGLSRSAGQLYALLYMSREPKCLDEMADSCEVSKATASVNNIPQGFIRSPSRHINENRLPRTHPMGW